MYQSWLAPLPAAHMLPTIYYRSCVCTQAHVHTCHCILHVLHCTVCDERGLKMLFHDLSQSIASIITIPLSLLHYQLHCYVIVI